MLKKSLIIFTTLILFNALWLHNFKALILLFIFLCIIDYFFKVRISSNNTSVNNMMYLFDKSPSMILKINIKSGFILQINDILALTLNAMHPYQVIGDSIFNIFADKDKLKKALHTLQRKGVLHQYTAEIITIDANKVPVSIDGIISQDEVETDIAFLYLTNISSIKKIEAKLEDNRNLLQSIINNTLEAVIITNKNGKIIEWNPQATQLLGQTKNQVINKTISTVVLSADNEHLFLEKDINNYLQKQETKFINKKAEFILISKLNKKIPVASCCFPVLTDNDNCIFCFFLSDISLLKQKELKIRELMSELEYSNQELQSFAYIASHDLKEPLRGIKNYALILQDEYKNTLDESGMNFLNNLIHSCNRLELLLDSLLQYSKVGNLQLDLKNINANHIIQEVKDTIHHLLKQKNATLRVEQLPYVMADESRLNEVFINLITNGLKYNDKAQPQITIGLSLEKSNDVLYCMYVKDNGIGIEKSKLDTVFQIFQRLHKKEEYGGGAGAGLTITKRIIERHHGTIWIESEPNLGTTFYFTLKKGSEPLNGINQATSN